jgi:hypothetical protein
MDTNYDDDDDDIIRNEGYGCLHVSLPMWQSQKSLFQGDPWGGADVSQLPGNFYSIPKPSWHSCPAIGARVTRTLRYHRVFKMTRKSYWPFVPSVPGFFRKRPKPGGGPNRTTWCPGEYQKYVSQRLLRDQSKPLFVLEWLNMLDLKNMDIEEQREMGQVISRGLRHYEADELNFGFLLSKFLSKFSGELREDESFMMPVVKLNWRALQYCSDRLCSNQTDLFQAAVSQNIKAAYQHAKGPIHQ